MAFTVNASNMESLLGAVRVSSTDSGTYVTLQKTQESDAAKRYRMEVYRSKGGNVAYVGFGSTFALAVAACSALIVTTWADQTTSSTDAATAYDVLHDALAALL